MMTEVASINTAIGRTSLDHLDRDPEVAIRFLRLEQAWKRLRLSASSPSMLHPFVKITRGPVTHLQIPGL
jgi:hypothetical protein